MFIVGIDVAKRSHEVCMITSDGQIVQRPFSIRNNCTGYNLMLEKIRKHTNIKSQIVFAMESTAHYWLALFTRLRKDGYHVILLNPIQTSAMRDMFIRKIKTDAKDSFIIAELIRFGRYAESNVAQDRLLALKELCRNRFYLVDMAGDLKRKLIALIDRVFPEYEAQFDILASIRLSISPASSRLRTRICPNGALRICADASGWRLRSLYSAILCSARITRRKPQKGSNT